jgi:hypothetical protein|tara:strand:+ start:4852 stop:5043 length:192 start_codon:yes stop_codon:yes gene_type:complete
MRDDVDLASSLKRMVADRRSLIVETLCEGLLKDMEHYKSLQGELTALNLVEQHIQDFYAKGER